MWYLWEIIIPILNVESMNNENVYLLQALLSFWIRLPGDVLKRIFYNAVQPEFWSMNIEFSDHLPIGELCHSLGGADVGLVLRDAGEDGQLVRLLGLDCYINVYLFI